MFFFCILSATEKITSSIKQGLWKMFITIIFYQVRFTEFRTHQFKSFSNSKYVAIALSFKVAVKHLIFQLCTCSGMCLLLNWKNCTLNLYVFLSALYTLQYVPIVIIFVIIYLFKKKKKKKKEKKNDPYFGMGKNTKVMPQYPTIYLFSWEREGILTSQNLT